MQERGGGERGGGEESSVGDKEGGLLAEDQEQDVKKMRNKIFRLSFRKSIFFNKFVLFTFTLGRIQSWGMVC